MPKIELGPVGAVVSPAAGGVADAAAELEELGFSTIWLTGGPLSSLRRIADVVHATHHWQHAEDWLRAFAATVEAARRAERIHAFAEAYRYWTGALRLHERAGAADGGLDRAVLLENAARAAHLCGEHDAAVGLMVTRIELAGGPAEDGALRHRQAQYLVAAGRVREAVEAYRAAAATFAGRSPLPGRTGSGRGWANGW